MRIDGAIVCRIMGQHPEIGACLPHSRARGVRREALPAALWTRFQQILDIPLYSLYGPTKAAVDVTFWECGRGDVTSSVSIGRPSGKYE